MRKILEDRNLPVTGWIEREKHAIGEMEAGRREGQGSFQERQARRLARMEGTEKKLISKKRRLQRMEDASKKVTVRL